MIIQTGMRTDIPAFYSKWFLNRIKEGYVCVRNPYNPKQVTKYSLSPEVVDLIAFCTKNPLPMLPFLDELKPYGQYWFVTITPYGRDIEPNVPEQTGRVPKRKKNQRNGECACLLGTDPIGVLGRFILTKLFDKAYMFADLFDRFFFSFIENNFVFFKEIAPFCINRYD